MTLLIALVAGYLGLLLVLSALVKGRRVEMVSLAKQMLDAPHSKREELLVLVDLKSMYSLWVAPAQVFAILAALITPMSVLESKALELFGDVAMTDERFDRFSRFITNFNLSVAAANPLFGLPAIVLRELYKVKIQIYVSRHPENARVIKSYRKCAT